MRPPDHAYLVPDCVSEVGLRSFGDLPLRAVATEENRGVVVGPEDRTTTDVVDYHQVAPLAGQLRPGVLHETAGLISGLRGEADQDLLDGFALP